MSKTLALVGNPNSGKTTLFNNLTGSKQYVGNWPGVTVERKGGKLKKHEGFEVMDLPKKKMDITKMELDKIEQGLAKFEEMRNDER